MPAKPEGALCGHALPAHGGLWRTGATGAAVTGGGPIDLALSDSGRFLYSVNTGTNTIGAFRVHSDGSLAALPFVSGLPGGRSCLSSGGKV